MTLEATLLLGLALVNIVLPAAHLLEHEYWNAAEEIEKTLKELEKSEQFLAKRLQTVEEQASRFAQRQEEEEEAHNDEHPANS